MTTKSTTESIQDIFHFMAAKKPEIHTDEEITNYEITCAEIGDGITDPGEQNFVERMVYAFSSTYDEQSKLLDAHRKCTNNYVRMKGVQQFARSVAHLAAVHADVEDIGEMSGEEFTHAKMLAETLWRLHSNEPVFTSFLDLDPNETIPFLDARKALETRTKEIDKVADEIQRLNWLKEKNPVVYKMETEKK